MIKFSTQLKAILFGLAVAVFGATVYIAIDAAYQLEEHFGLDTLFYVRGIKPPPNEVVVIAMEKSSSDAFQVPNHPVDWPRDFHARLIDQLQSAGAAAIAFDIFFKRPQSPDSDARLSDAIQRSDKVILFSYLQRDIHAPDSTLDEKTASPGLNIERLIPPIAVFADHATAVAPFVLPKYPIKVTKFWTYRVSAGDIPNIPAVALQLYAMDVYPWLQQQLTQSTGKPLPDAQSMIAARSIVQTMIAIRALFTSDPSLAEQLLDQLRNDTNTNDSSRQKITALIALYSGAHRHYLNFYGPPWTIRTIPYHQALSQDAAQLNLSGKAVFVGFSERLQPEQKDNFNTVYSQTDGLDLSGVEIAATAFANLLHQHSLTPLPPLVFIAVVCIYGFIVGFAARSYKPVIAATIVAAISFVYLLTSIYLFSHQHIWLPWVIPFLLLSPLTLFIAISWHYFDAYQERQRIRAAFGMYLPDNVISEISKRQSPLKEYQQVIYGIVLATDAAEYTNISETMSALELRTLMNQYYTLLFSPVKKHGGVVCDVVGDAMMAIWSAPQVNAELRQKACLAAIDIKQNLGLEKNKEFALPTRIGLHAGEVALANVGALDHYEYRAVGDIVNTASRIEGFNKHMGTRCLASADAIQGTSGLLHRELGTFTLAGKSRPLVLHEILSTEQNAAECELKLCKRFVEGVTAYRVGDIPTANGIFTELNTEFPHDGPTRFYVELCRRIDENLSTFKWNSVISINSK